MQVYLVWAEFANDEADLAGVYSTKEQAEQRILWLRNQSYYVMPRLSSQMVTLDKPIPLSLTEAEADQ